MSHCRASTVSNVEVCTDTPRCRFKGAQTRCIVPSLRLFGLVYQCCGEHAFSIIQACEARQERCSQCNLLRYFGLLSSNHRAPMVSDCGSLRIDRPSLMVILYHRSSNDPRPNAVVKIARLEFLPVFFERGEVVEGRTAES